MLKLIADQVPAGLETYYEQTDGGKFRLKVEDAVHVSEVESLKQKNKEFRENNIALLKEKEKYQTFSSLVGGDLTPEKFTEKVESLATTRISSMTQEMKNAYEAKIKDLETNYTKTSSRLSKLVLDSEVTKVATEHGVLSSALEDVMLRAKNSFDVVDGEVKFREDKLDAEGKPFSIQSWIQEQKTKAPHLFAQSQGTGPTRPKGSGMKVSGEGLTGIDRISAALANRNNSSAKKLN